MKGKDRLIWMSNWCLDRGVDPDDDDGTCWRLARKALSDKDKLVTSRRQGSSARLVKGQKSFRLTE